jgi:hypothetical protein
MSNAEGAHDTAAVVRVKGRTVPDDMAIVDLVTFTVVDPGLLNMTV